MTHIQLTISRTRIEQKVDRLKASIDQQAKLAIAELEAYKAECISNAANVDTAGDMDAGQLNRMQANVSASTTRLSSFEPNVADLNELKRKADEDLAVVGASMKKLKSSLLMNRIDEFELKKVTLSNTLAPFSLYVLLRIKNHHF